MDGPTRGAVTDQLYAPELGGQDGLVDPLELVGGLALDHGARHVGEIMGGRGAREYVEDDALVGAYGAGALIVRVNALVSAGDDRVLGDAVILHQRHVDDLLEVLRGKRPPFPDHLVAADHARPEHIEGSGQRGLGVALGLLDGGHLLGGLDHPLGGEWIGSPLPSHPALRQPLGGFEREVGGHLDRACAVVLEQQADGIGEPRLRPPLLGLGLPLGEREDLVHPGLLSGPVDLEVRHEQDLPAVDLDEDEWVGRDEAGGVVEVGVYFAGGDDQRRGHAAAPRRVSYWITGLACWLTSSRLAMPSSPRWKRYSTWAPASSRARSRV